jgi:hypothetical protein
MAMMENDVLGYRPPLSKHWTGQWQADLFLFSVCRQLPLEAMERVFPCKIKPKGKIYNCGRTISTKEFSRKKITNRLSEKTVRNSALSLPRFY